MLFNNAYSGLITGGLGLDAVHGMISVKFHLFVLTNIIIVPSTIGGGGGYFPGAWNVFPPGTSGQIYKPVIDPSKPPHYYLVRDKLYKTRVVIRIIMGKKHFEHYYLISPRTPLMLAKIQTLIIKITEKPRIYATNIKRLSANVFIGIETPYKDQNQ